MGISMIVLLFLLAGAINFGIAFFDYVAIRDAAQEGALYGSINPPTDNENGTLNLDTTSIVTRVQQSSSSPVNLLTAPTAVTFDTTAKRTCPGHLLTVKVAYDSPVLMPIVGIFTNTIHITASAVSSILISKTPGCP
jgi:Flp pilus assembly protein TadG